jgi:hypothetical protein
MCFQLGIVRFLSPPSSGVLGDIMHRKSTKKLQDRNKRKIRGIILNNSLYDRKTSEFVSKMTRLDVLGQLHEPIEVHLVPDFEVGEVLIDTRGQGSLQSQMS